MSEILEMHPDTSFTSTLASELIPSLCDIAQMHFNTLQKFQKSGILGKDNWLNRYYSMFGIPQESAYTRKRSIGRMIGNQRKALNFESLISSLLGYITPDTAPKEHKQLNDLLHFYTCALEDLERNTPKGYNFKELLNFEPRSKTTQRIN